MLQYANSLTAVNEQVDDCSYWDDAQSISGNNIDPEKLLMMLRIKFGAGAYDLLVGFTSCIEMLDR
jgi:hypothetical protein